MRYLTIFLSLMCMLFAADAAQDSAKADKRVAFVVGNGAYRNVATLPNPAIDPRRWQRCFATSASMSSRHQSHPRYHDERLLEFGQKAQGADVAVFFYAGHGIRHQRHQLPAAVDADIKSEMDVKLAPPSTSNHRRPDHGDAKVKLVFLDAAATIPLPQDQVERVGDPQRLGQLGLAEMNPVKAR